MLHILKLHGNPWKVQCLVVPPCACQMVAPTGYACEVSIGLTSSRSLRRYHLHCSLLPLRTSTFSWPSMQLTSCQEPVPTTFASAPSRPAAFLVQSLGGSSRFPTVGCWFKPSDLEKNRPGMPCGRSRELRVESLNHPVFEAHQIARCSVDFPQITEICERWGQMMPVIASVFFFFLRLFFFVSGP